MTLGIWWCHQSTWDGKFHRTAENLKVAEKQAQTSMHRKTTICIFLSWRINRHWFAKTTAQKKAGWTMMIKIFQLCSPIFFLRCGKSYIPTVPSCMNNWLIKSVTSYEEFTVVNWVMTKFHINKQIHTRYASRCFWYQPFTKTLKSKSQFLKSKFCVQYIEFIFFKKVYPLQK